MATCNACTGCSVAKRTHPFHEKGFLPRFTSMASVLFSEIPDVPGGISGPIHQFFSSYRPERAGRAESGVVFISPRCNDLVLPNLVRAFYWTHPRGDVFTTYRPSMFCSDEFTLPDWLTHIPSRFSRPCLISTGSLSTRFGAERRIPTMFVLHRSDITPTLLKSIHKDIVSTNYYLIITDGLALGLHHFFKNTVAVLPTPTQPLCISTARTMNSGKAEAGCAQAMSTYAVRTRAWSLIFYLKAKDRLPWTIDPMCTDSQSSL